MVLVGLRSMTLLLNIEKKACAHKRVKNDIWQWNLGSRKLAYRQSLESHIGDAHTITMVRGRSVLQNIEKKYFLLNNKSRKTYDYELWCIYCLKTCDYIWVTGIKVKVTLIKIEEKVSFFFPQLLQLWMISGNETWRIDILHRDKTELIVWKPLLLK